MMGRLSPEWQWKLVRGNAAKMLHHDSEANSFA